MMLESPRPTVSVIMPVYNVEAYVGDAIRSVLAQSFSDFELIVVDDAGADRSLAICRSFDDSRIRIVTQRNRGLAGARNTGIALARGRYIALLDSDDLWEPRKLAIHITHLEADLEVGASYGGSELIDGTGRRLGIYQRPKPGMASAKVVFCGRTIANGSVPVFRREMLEEGALPGDRAGRVYYFDETLRRSEDVECWTRLALISRFKFAAVSEILTLYRINAGGLSADVVRQLASWDEVCAKLARISPSFIAAHGREARGRELRYLARRCVQIRDRGLGLTLALEALSHCPRLLFEEPGKTLTTLVACFAMRSLSNEAFGRLLRIASPRLAEESAS
jgi:glycosyltransferase involved in cell wall biosynthesis